MSDYEWVMGEPLSFPSISVVEQAPPPEPPQPTISVEALKAVLQSLGHTEKSVDEAIVAALGNSPQ